MLVRLPTASSARLGGEADFDAVGVFAADVFAAVLDEADDVASRAFGEEFRRELGGEDDDDAVIVGRGPAGLGA